MRRPLHIRSIPNFDASYRTIAILRLLAARVTVEFHGWIRRCATRLNRRLEKAAVIFTSSRDCGNRSRSTWVLPIGLSTIRLVLADISSIDV